MDPTIDFDRVLAAPPPDLDEAAILAVASETFGLTAAIARDLGSERDQTFLLLDDADRPLAVMKLSNAAEDAAILDMEALAVRHVGRVDPGLPLARPWPRPGAKADDPDPSAYRVTFTRGGHSHHVRMYDVLAGRQRMDALDLSDAALVAWGTTTARVGYALRGFFHPAARRTMLWDVQHAARTRTMADAIRDERRRAMVERVLERHASVLEPAWPALRAQLVHGDLTTDNALTDDDGRITGIVDFGDMSHSALLIDLASVLDSLCAGRGPTETFRTARLVIDGYQRIMPLEPVELRLLPEAWATRAAVTVAISSWRADRGLEDAAFAERYNVGVTETMAVILDMGWDEAARQLGADVPRTTIDGAAGRARRAALIERRARVFGPAMEPLTYAEPIEMAHAEGVWMTDIDGRRYLDAYNNVPCVGHAHPRVTAAIARASRRLNTNLRYLHEDAIVLAERIIATMPSGLDTVLFVNSGSEANDLAWRLAVAATGASGGLCTPFAYHGITAATAVLSPEMWPADHAPAHVETWRLPSTDRGQADHAHGADESAVADAIAALDHRGLRLAAAIMDGVLTSDGFPVVDAPLVRAWREDVRSAGALWIADEVQGGHGRTGESMWSFERFGIEPDVVTLGKPMGNGHPIGAVVTRHEIAAQFAEETVFFSTFAGNQVSAAAALAVLDVIRDERVLQRTVMTGAALRDAIRDLATTHDAIQDVRGVGLAIGVAFADGGTASVVKDGLRTRGVLVGTCGARGDVLKVRPPLAFTTDDIPVFAEALDGALRAG